MALFDLRAAFNSMDRKVLVKAMGKGNQGGAHGEGCRDIKETKNRIRVGGEVGENFCTVKGVRQDVR